MQRGRVPRPLAAVAIVIGTFGAFAVTIGLISAPLLEWTSRLPELAALLRQRAAVFERPLAYLAEAASYFGFSNGVALEWPKIEWVQPTLEFLSPTFAELLLFVATLVLFIASWPELRRALILTFPDRPIRLLTLRVLNEIEESLAGYLVTVTLINIGVGVLAGLVCALFGMPNPLGLGALAATLNFVPIIGPVATFIVLLAIGMHQHSQHRNCLARATCIRSARLPRGPLRDAGDHRTPAFPERACRLPGACILDLAVGADRRIPELAAPDCWAGDQAAPATRPRCGHS